MLFKLLLTALVNLIIRIIHWIYKTYISWVNINNPIINFLLNVQKVMLILLGLQLLNPDLEDEDIIDILTYFNVVVKFLIYFSILTYLVLTVYNYFDSLQTFFFYTYSVKDFYPDYPPHPIDFGLYLYNSFNLIFFNNAWQIGVIYIKFNIIWFFQDIFDSLQTIFFTIFFAFPFVETIFKFLINKTIESYPYFNFPDYSLNPLDNKIYNYFHFFILFLYTSLIETEMPFPFITFEFLLLIRYFYLFIFNFCFVTLKYLLLNYFIYIIPLTLYIFFLRNKYTLYKYYKIPLYKMSTIIMKFNTLYLLFYIYKINFYQFCKDIYNFNINKKNNLISIFLKYVQKYKILKYIYNKKTFKIYPIWVNILIFLDTLWLHPLYLVRTREDPFLFLLIYEIIDWLAIYFKLQTEIDVIYEYLNYYFLVANWISFFIYKQNFNIFKQQLLFFIYIDNTSTFKIIYEINFTNYKRYLIPFIQGLFLGKKYTIVYFKIKYNIYGYFYKLVHIYLLFINKRTYIYFVKTFLIQFSKLTNILIILYIFLYGIYALLKYLHIIMTFKLAFLIKCIFFSILLYIGYLLPKQVKQVFLILLDIYIIIFIGLIIFIYISL